MTAIDDAGKSCCSLGTRLSAGCNRVDADVRHVGLHRWLRTCRGRSFGWDSACPITDSLTHTPVFALALGLVAGMIARRRGWDAWRAVMAVTLVLGSHGVLDALAQEGRGIMFLWPVTDTRYHFPWRPIPDAPTGLAFFSHKGMQGLTIELIYFLPFVFYALVLPHLRLARFNVRASRTRLQSPENSGSR